MAKLIAKPQLVIRAAFELDEAELAALEYLTSYGDKVFIDVFSEHLGGELAKSHKAGITSLFAELRNRLPRILEQAQKARQCASES